MKTQNSNFTSVWSNAILLATLFALSSCTKESTKEKPAPLTRSNVKAPDIDIHTAVVSGNLEALKQHIVAGTDLNEKDPFGGSSPLISAAVFGKTEEARLLIDAGADLNFQNNEGSTPLHTSAFFCRPEIVKMLLDKGAGKNIKNKFGATPRETVMGPFSDAKSIYDMMGQMLSPMGLTLDYVYIEKTRPVIADMLK